MVQRGWRPDGWWISVSRYAVSLIEHNRHITHPTDNVLGRLFARISDFLANRNFERTLFTSSELAEQGNGNESTQLDAGTDVAGLFRAERDFRRTISVSSVTFGALPVDGGKPGVTNTPGLFC
jgi:hypothetical protein